MFKPTFFEALCEIVGDDSDTKVGGGKTDGPISEIRFNDETDKPTDAEVQTKLASMISDWDAQEYARKREAEYPSVQECVHAILDDTLDALQAKRASVKLKYPKGG